MAYVIVSEDPSRVGEKFGAYLASEARGFILPRVKRYELDDAAKISFGSGDCQIQFICDTGVSALHGHLIRQDDGSYAVAVDCSSTDGIKIYKQKIPSNVLVQLRNGAAIELGAFSKIIYHCRETETEPETEIYETE